MEPVILATERGDERVSCDSVKTRDPSETFSNLVQVVKENDKQGDYPRTDVTSPKFFYLHICGKQHFYR